MDLDQYLAVANADVVEWPRLSQQVRLEREQAAHSYHVLDSEGRERGIFYTKEAAIRFCDRFWFKQFEKRPILKQF
jgi:hypothetical protein